MQASFVAIDVETANADRSTICQLGAVRVERGEIRETLSTLVDPQAFFDPWNVEIHGITEDDVRDQPVFAEVAPRLEAFIGSNVVASHTAFDRVAIERAHERYELESALLDLAGHGACGSPGVVPICGVRLRPRQPCCALADRVSTARRRGGRASGSRDSAPRDEGLRPRSDGMAREGPPASQPGTDCPGRRSGRERLAGEVVLFTGALSIRRADAAAMAAAAGCKVREGPATRGVTMLVVGQQDLSKLGGYTKSSKQRGKRVPLGKAPPLPFSGSTTSSA